MKATQRAKRNFRKAVRLAVEKGRTCETCAPLLRFIPTGPGYVFRIPCPTCGNEIAMQPTRAARDVLFQRLALSGAYCMNYVQISIGGKLHRVIEQGCDGEACGLNHVDIQYPDWQAFEAAHADVQ